jgi:hypothetical protein
VIRVISDRYFPPSEIPGFAQKVHLDATGLSGGGSRCRLQLKLDNVKTPPDKPVASAFDGKEFRV